MRSVPRLCETYRRWSTGVVLPRGHLAALVATLLWGATGPLAKVLVTEAGFLTIGAVRVLAAALLLAIILAWRRGRRAFALPRADLTRVVALAVLGLVGCQIAWLYALAALPVSVTVILSNTSPLFVALMAALWLGEPLRGRAALGLVISLAGIVLLVSGDEGPGGPVDLGGAIAALASAAAWAAYMVGGRALLARYDPLRLAAITLLIAALCWLPLALVFQPPWGRAIAPAVWLGAIYLGAVPMALGSLLWYSALRHLRTVQVGVFQYLTPVWATLIAALWLGEPLTLSLVVSMLLVFAGVRFTQAR